MKKKKRIICISIYVLLVVISFVVGFAHQWFYYIPKELEEKRQHFLKEELEQNKLKEDFILHPDSVNYIIMTRKHHCYEIQPLAYFNERMEVDSIEELDVGYSPYEFERASYEDELIYAMIVSNRGLVPDAAITVYHLLSNKKEMWGIEDSLEHFIPNKKMKDFVEQHYNQPQIVKSYGKDE